MNTYENLSREELIQRIKVLETDIAQYAMKDAEIEKMNENLLNQRKINFLNILMNTILSNIFVAISVKDVFDSFKYIYFNQAAEDFMGVNASEVIGKTDFDIFSDPRRAHEIRTEDYSTINNGRTYKSMVEYEKPNGEFRVVNIIRLLITNPDPGASPLILAMLWDITEQRQNELDLIKAQEADKMKNAFIANMSHEIRTPLNAIVGFSGILASTEEEQEKQEYVSIIENNNTLLLQLISDILDLSKIEAGTLELNYSNIELNELMRELERGFLLRVKTDAVKLEFVEPAEPCMVHTEKNRLSQLMINLVTNAIKFTEKGSIRFSYEMRENELYFYVTDTGCGIPKDKQQNIFGRFVKLNSFAQGTGLGLSICQTLMERMGGRIGVESEEGKGSTFWFTLPYKPAVKEDKKQTPKNIQPVSVERNKLTILVAEDNASNYKLFESILKYDYHLIHAWDGMEAVEMFREHNPQIVLMDINMPVMDGYEATREIRKFSAKIPIIAVTAFAYASDEQKVMESGFDGYMPKPINAKLLKAQLMDIMQKRIILL